jgi:tetratricopeptide (TPR) repeat protein
VQVQSALYDKGDYFFQLGVGFLRGNIADALMGEDEAAPQHVFLARVERATQLFEGSLETNPGNAATWTNLAWAHALLGNEEGARSALDHSWNLAPFNNGQAFERMILAISLDKASEPLAPQAATSSTGFQNDREVLRTYDAGRHENLVRQHSDMME